MPIFKTLSPFMAIGGRRKLVSDDSGFIAVENDDDVARCRAHPYCVEVQESDSTIQKKEKTKAKEVKDGRSDTRGAGSKA